MFKPLACLTHWGAQDVLAYSQLASKQGEVGIKQESTAEGEREAEYGNEEIQEYCISSKRMEK